MTCRLHRTFADTPTPACRTLRVDVVERDANSFAYRRGAASGVRTRVLRPIVASFNRFSDWLDRRGQSGTDGGGRST